MQLSQVYLTDEILKFFNLARDPFDDPQSLQEMFMPRELEELARDIVSAVLRQKFVVIAGRTGCGKSVLKQRAIFQALEKRPDIRFCIVQNFRKERVNARHILSSILLSLNASAGVPSDDEKLARAIIKLLADEAMKGHRVIIVIDEAHALTVRAFRALKRLFECHKETSGFGFNRACGILLVGQSELRIKLRARDLDEVRRRMVAFDMDSLGISKRKKKTGEVTMTFRYAGKYVLERLKSASRNGAAEKILHPESLKLLKALALTYLDANVIMSRALKLAFEREKKVVTPDILEKASR